MLIKSKTENTHVLVHENCRKRFNDKRKLTATNTKDTWDTRKPTSLFNWKKNCFFCNQHCIEDHKSPSRREWHLASTLQIRQSVILAFQSRPEADPKVNGHYKCKDKFLVVLTLLKLKLATMQTAGFVSRVKDHQ